MFTAILSVTVRSQPPVHAGFGAVYRVWSFPRKERRETPDIYWLCERAQEIMIDHFTWGNIQACGLPEMSLLPDATLPARLLVIAKFRP